MRSIGSLPCGEMIRRPLGSVVMLTHEPSPGWALRSSSTLKPSGTVKVSAAVADFAVPATVAAARLPHGWMPSLPSEVAATQFAPGLKPKRCHPASAIVLVCQFLSVTIVVRVPSSLAMVTSASNAAMPPSFSALMVRTFSPSASSALMSNLGKSFHSVPSPTLSPLR